MNVLTSDWSGPFVSLEGPDLSVFESPFTRQGSYVSGRITYGSLAITPGVHNELSGERLPHVWSGVQHQDIYPHTSWHRLQLRDLQSIIYRSCTPHSFKPSVSYRWPGVIHHSLLFSITRFVNCWSLTKSRSLPQFRNHSS